MSHSSSTSSVVLFLFFFAFITTTYVLKSALAPVWPDWAIYCTLGQIFKAGGKNYFAQIAHIFDNFCKVVKIFNLSSAIIFGQLLQTFGDFLLVTLTNTNAVKLEGSKLLWTTVCWTKAFDCWLKYILL